ncbi:hypothetical protein [Acidipila sp. EB88]|uniref:hypothetical protein n=1 Tax=Acidipila sp. EB88 TaxID=2305226 RepID=UPI000F5D88D5|nr:hypothetical protein [Acidipila sp. EB88]RRA48520.1 hypothetical protein D1Y84_09685 [Acidipila sp. EB88]
MHTQFAALLLVMATWSIPVQGSDLPMPQTRLPSGILQSVENATVRSADHGLVLERIDRGVPMQLHFADCQGIGVEREAAQWWIVPTGLAKGPVHANHDFWVLPADPMSQNKSWHLDVKGAELTASAQGAGLVVSLDAQSLALSTDEARPHSDPFGNRFALNIQQGPALENALAAFYWGTMLPSVVEKTMAAHFPYSSGYVLSTLNVQSYAGSYPAVDHEFQIRGRVAMATEADLDIVQRMLALQFKLMDDDPEKLYRSPTSVQPNGTREYHIRRDSKDAHQNAAMFPLTANIEVLEESWHYYAARKDAAWLRSNIAHLENAAGWVLQNTDSYGRAWSDVYYEDQVIKDGRETEAQAFAAHAFQLLADMESLLGRKDQATLYAATSRKMAAALIAPLPDGYWNPRTHRFVDWVDRNGQAHDHTPLLANTLPLTFGYATEAQTAAVQQLMEANAAQFEQFPSFVAADIAAYDSSEMGTAGPYDLSAAGRYWYWDAAFRAVQDQNALLARQLETVAAEGSRNGYFMGERYDMDHVYYIDGKDAHGAEKYYEYPNVYAAVLINKYLGLEIPADADLSVSPHLVEYGEVEFANPAYAVRYSYNAEGFTLKNLAAKTRRVDVDLSALGSAHGAWKITAPVPRVGVRFHMELAPGQQASWVPAP